MSMRLLCLAAIAGFLCLSCSHRATLSAQSAAVPPVPSSSGKFDQEPIILRDARMVAQYNADGTGSRTESQSVTLQSEAAVRKFGVIGVAYASATQTAEFVFVRVHHADGTTTETPLDAVQEQPAPVTQQAPFYSDLKLKQIPVRALREGDTVEWQTRTVFVHPEAANQFWSNFSFVHDAVTLHQTIELRVPTQSKATVWTDPSIHVTPERTTEGADTVYRWQWSSLKPTVGKEAEAAKKAAEGKLLTADEEVSQTDGALPDIAITTFPDWAAVGAWYRSLAADRARPDATIRAKVAEITAHSATEQQKVQAVYDWVSANIRYIGVAFGIGRYQPHSASAVLENQYGDCKDKHTLLASMLLALGEQPDAVLIGSGVRFNRAVPSPASFNHLITHLTLDGKPVWLDSTAEVAGYQVLIPSLRDKQALVIPQSAAANIQQTPRADLFAPTQSMQVVGTLDKDLNSDSEITLVLHDDSELIIRAVLHQISPAQYTELAQRMMQGMSFGGTVTDASFVNTGDLEKPLELHFHYRRDRNPDWGTDRVTLAFSPTEVPVVDPKSPPNSSIRLGQPRTSTSTVDMRLPAGWTAELPEAIHTHLPQVAIDTVYHLKGDHLLAERTTHILADKVPATDWKTYQKWYDESNAGDVPYIQLRHLDRSKPSIGRIEEKPSAATPKTDELPVSPAQKAAEASRLITEANDRIQGGDYDGAERSLKSAEALDPQAAALWGDYGAIALRRGNDETALKLYTKEVELHPESDFAWQTLIRIHQLRSEKPAAEETARNWVHAEPESAASNTMLLELLLRNGKKAEALTAAHDALKQVPAANQNEPFRYQVAEVDLSGGEHAQGVALLSGLLAPEVSSAVRNNASYRLAQLHEKLPDAEATQRELLLAMAKQSANWTGDESLNTLLGTSHLLVAGWDTLGYILHQQGREAEAESYIRAAWTNRQRAEIGEHLADVLDAEHKTAEAQHIRSLASAMPATPASKGMPPHRTATEQKLSMDLQALREYPVQLGTPAKETTRLRVMLQRGGITRVDPDTGTATAEQQAAARSLPTQRFFPRESDATLVRVFFLNCATAAKCDMILQP